MYLTKHINLANSEVKLNDSTGVFRGYGSVFDGVDSVLDTIKKGAFLDTLKTHGLPKMFYQHKTDMPIGKYTNADEDSKGLWLEGELTPGHSRASDVRAALKHQTLDGLSISGYIQKDGYQIQPTGGRVISKWTELTEVSVVVWPADSAARVDPGSVKSMDFEVLLPECKSVKDIERLLRDAGLGKWEAMALISRAKSIFERRDAGEDDIANAVAEMGKLHARLQAVGTRWC